MRLPELPASLRRPPLPPGEFGHLSRRITTALVMTGGAGYLLGSIIPRALERTVDMPILPFMLLAAVICLAVVEAAERWARRIAHRHHRLIRRRVERTRALHLGARRSPPAVQGRCGDCGQAAPQRHDRSCPQVPPGWFREDDASVKPQPHTNRKEGNDALSRGAATAGGPDPD